MLKKATQQRKTKEESQRPRSREKDGGRRTVVQGSLCLDFPARTFSQTSTPYRLLWKLDINIPLSHKFRSEWVIWRSVGVKQAVRSKRKSERRSDRRNEWLNIWVPILNHCALPCLLASRFSLCSSNAPALCCVHMFAPLLECEMWNYQAVT